MYMKRRVGVMNLVAILKQGQISYFIVLIGDEKRQAGRQIHNQTDN